MKEVKTLLLSWRVNTLEAEGIHRSNSPGGVDEVERGAEEAREGIGKSEPSGIGSMKGSAVKSHTLEFNLLFDRIALKPSPEFYASTTFPTSIPRSLTP